MNPRIPPIAPQTEVGTGRVYHPGMTMLDYFAAAAITIPASGDYDLSSEEMAHDAYDIAEAMLAESRKRHAKLENAE